MTKPIIPEAALAQHIAVLGKTGSGKTFAIKGIVESLLSTQRRVGIVDPTGAWWGLRSSHDGKSAGFPILVLGGDHGDLPLPALGGAAVARLLAEQNVNLIADTSQLTVGERTRWFVDFGRELYRLNRAPLHLVIDEAHTFAPQGKVPDPDTGKMLHAANQLASGGRSRGIRLTMITQRPQKLHKDTLTCADTLIAMRVLAPQDRLAVEDWIKGCGDMAQGKDILNSLASLKRGEGWAWYPEGGFLKRLTFPQITTFDSSATPTDGHVITAPKGMADIDLTEIKAAMADAVKEAEANDPKLLRAEIARLRAEAVKKPVQPGTSSAEAMRDAEAKGYNLARDACINWMAGILTDIQIKAEPLSKAVASLDQTLQRVKISNSTSYGLKPPALRQRHVTPAPAVASAASTPVPQTYPKRHTPDIQRSAAGPGEPMKPMPRAILTALAQHPDGLSKGQILVHTGYRSSGPVSKCFAELARDGWTATAIIGKVRITDAGLAALGDYEPLPTGDALREQLLNGSKLAPMEKKLLRSVIEAYPDAIGKGRVLEQTGYASSGPVSKAFAYLVAIGYATKDGRGALKASDDLFT